MAGRRRNILRMIVRAGLVLVLLSFPFGPLFPWSAWKPGYERLRLARADVFYPAGRPLPSAFRNIDRYVVESERFHQLRVRSRITVVLVGSWWDWMRFMPQRATVRPGAVTLQTGTIIYVTPRVAERGFDHGEFLRHEIAHATVHQNQSWLAALRTNRQDAEPFVEGLACAFGRHRAFKKPDEVVAYVKSHDVGPIVDPAQREERGDMRLNYPVWRFFLEYVMETRGRDRFQQLLLQTMKQPGQYPAIFASVYGEGIGPVARQFEKDLRTGRWLPGVSLLDMRQSGLPGSPDRSPGL